MAHRFEVWQDGIMVASVEHSEHHVALKEISHYAMLYERDGPIEIREIRPYGYRRPKEPTQRT